METRTFSKILTSEIICMKCFGIVRKNRRNIEIRIFCEHNKYHSVI